MQRTTLEESAILQRSVLGPISLGIFLNDPKETLDGMLT